MGVGSFSPNRRWFVENGYMLLNFVLNGDTNQFKVRLKHKATLQYMVLITMALHGLKQSLRAWFGKLQKFGMKQSLT